MFARSYYLNKETEFMKCFVTVDIVHNINPENFSTIVRRHLSGNLGKIALVSVK